MLLLSDGPYPSPVSLDITAPDDVETPEHLMTEEEVEELVRKLQPAFVPLAGPGADGVSHELIVCHVIFRVCHMIRINAGDQQCRLIP